MFLLTHKWYLFLRLTAKIQKPTSRNLSMHIYCYSAVFIKIRVVASPQFETVTSRGGGGYDFLYEVYVFTFILNWWDWTFSVLTKFLWRSFKCSDKKCIVRNIEWQFSVKSKQFFPWTGVAIKRDIILFANSQPIHFSSLLGFCTIWPIW